MELNRCGLCPNKHKCIPPEIHGEGGILLVAEGPGWEEDRANRLFVGKTGRELREHYLPLAGLRSGEVNISNSILCLPDRPKGKISLNNPKDVDLALTCAEHHLYQEIESLRPEVIVAMGAFACYVLDPAINLELQHGIPVETVYGTVFPMYHPASGIHEPKRMLLLRNDWHRLSKYLKGRLEVSMDKYPNPVYKLATSKMLLDWYLPRGFINETIGPMACDTEVTRGGAPYCLTFSTAPGHALLIKVDDIDSLDIFQSILDIWEGPILWHNWLFDSRVVAAMGLTFPHRLIVDTMQVAYHLGNLPQGLKALCYRLLGMKMEDFDDLVTPYSMPKCIEYIREASQIQWPKPDGKRQGINTKLKRFFTDYKKNPNLDVFARWSNWDAHHAEIQDKMGSWPGRDIRHVPFDKALHYACRDADGLVRLWPILKAMTKRVRKMPQERWG